MGWCSGGDKLDQDIFDAMAQFFSQLLESGERLAGELGVPTFCMKAMHRLDTSLTMKELGRRMNCDPSFVTMIADALEQRGLAKREPSALDRRIKNLVLTEKGIEAKAAIERELLGHMPWAGSLDTSERETLLALIRKMTKPTVGAVDPSAGDRAAREVSAAKPTASPAAH